MSLSAFIASCSFAAWTLFQNNLIIGFLCLTLANCTAFGNTIAILLSIEKSCLSKYKELSIVGFGLFGSIVMTSGIFGPMSAGYIIDYYGYTACVLMMSGVLLITSGIFVLFKVEQSSGDITKDSIDVKI